MYKKILIGYDGSEGAKAALRRGITLGRELNAEVWALWARSSLPHYPETVDEVEEEKGAADAYFERLRGEITAAGNDEGLDVHADCRSGHAPKTIVDYAREGGFDLIVLGHSGHSKLWGSFLGHTPDKVSENAHCSVLIVR